MAVTVAIVRRLSGFRHLSTVLNTMFCGDDGGRWGPYTAHTPRQYLLQLQVYVCGVTAGLLK